VRRMFNLHGIRSNCFRAVSRETELPTQHACKGVSRVGVNISESCSPNPFRHDNTYSLRTRKRYAQLFLILP
jgi:hypothetical protein